MKFSIVSAALALASTVVAMPDSNICGQANLNCCNEQKTEFDSDVDPDAGLLNKLLDIGDIKDITLFGQCSDIDLPSM